MKAVMKAVQSIHHTWVTQCSDIVQWKFSHIFEIYFSLMEDFIHEVSVYLIVP